MMCWFSWQIHQKWDLVFGFGSYFLLGVPYANKSKRSKVADVFAAHGWSWFWYKTCVLVTLNWFKAGHILSLKDLKHLETIQLVELSGWWCQSYPTSTWQLDIAWPERNLGQNHREPALLYPVAWMELKSHPNMKYPYSRFYGPNDGRKSFKLKTHGLLKGHIGGMASPWFLLATVGPRPDRTLTNLPSGILWSNHQKASSSSQTLYGCGFFPKLPFSGRSSWIGSRDNLDGKAMIHEKI